MRLNFMMSQMSVRVDVSPRSKLADSSLCLLVLKSTSDGVASRISIGSTMDGLSSVGARFFPCCTFCCCCCCCSFGSLCWCKSFASACSSLRCCCCCCWSFFRLLDGRNCSCLSSSSPSQQSTLDPIASLVATSASGSTLGRGKAPRRCWRVLREKAPRMDTTVVADISTTKAVRSVGVGCAKIAKRRAPFKPLPIITSNIEV
mmetsp:Transcript_71795/g.156322  ORF Transcript_71795/g.156322 Transcript_71795/m.156322 type:complete len:203 (+) Transcript_71795:827-1435(+)